jgi:hypothetical protein
MAVLGVLRTATTMFGDDVRSNNARHHPTPNRSSRFVAVHLLHPASVAHRGACRVPIYRSQMMNYYREVLARQMFS